jgi:hypothetical protein
MRFLLRVIVIFIVISTILSTIRNLFAPSQPRSRIPEQEPPRSSASGHLVKDPVCGTYILEETAIRAKDAFFCSDECRRKYLAS